MTSSDGKDPQPSPKEDIRHVELLEPRPASTYDGDADDSSDHYSPHPNKWARFRGMIREPAAEFLGTMVLVLFGDGAICQVGLSANSRVTSTPKGEYTSISFGMAIGVALGVWVAGGISGGHVNPAVTLSLAVFRGFPWKKVPIYIFAQVMGALCGAACLYANYFHAIDIVEGGRGIRTVPGTAGLFATYSLPYMTAVSSFFNEFLGTALLLIVILAAIDKGNISPPKPFLPIIVFFTIFGIGAGLGMQTGFALNPARDLGPRLLTAMVGYGRHVFSFRNQYWLWCPILGPLAGGLAGAFVYDAFIFVGSESILNLPDASARAHHRERTARKLTGDKLPTGVNAV